MVCRFATALNELTGAGLEAEEMVRLTQHAENAKCRVEAVFPAPGDADYARTFTQVQPPAWLESGAEASGRFLAEVGLPMPILNPEHGLLLKVTTVGS